MERARAVSLPFAASNRERTLSNSVSQKRRAYPSSEGKQQIDNQMEETRQEKWVKGTYDCICLYSYCLNLQDSLRAARAVIEWTVSVYAVQGLCR